MPIARAPAATATSARFAMRSTAAKNTHELPVPTHARTRTLFAAATSLLRRRLSDACMTTPLARADARRWRSAKVPQSRDVDCRRCSRLWELALRGTVTMVDLGWKKFIGLAGGALPQYQSGWTRVRRAISASSRGRHPGALSGAPPRKMTLGRDGEASQI